MGAPRLHPREGGTVVDGSDIAAMYGKTNSDIYRMARTGFGGFPPPIGAPDVWKTDPQNWRWSRRRIHEWIEGVAA